MVLFVTSKQKKTKQTNKLMILCSNFYRICALPIELRYRENHLWAIEWNRHSHIQAKAKQNETLIEGMIYILRIQFPPIWVDKNRFAQFCATYFVFMNTFMDDFEF